jgi:hypothetical protein
MILQYKPFLQKGKDLVLSSDFIKSGKKFKGHCKMLNHFKLISHRINEGIRCFDPLHYEHAEALRVAVEKKYPFARALGIIDNLVYEGHEVLLNVHSGDHYDRQDPKRAWAGMVALGYHRGGYLVLPQLGVRIRLEPGDIVFIRGRMLRHFVEDWEGGQRICIPHFTHSSIWRLMNMHDLVGLDEIPEDEEVVDEEWEEWELEECESGEGA